MPKHRNQFNSSRVPKFSVIMPSRLTPYPGCAKRLDRKLIRAIESVLKQSFTELELIVISDECNITKRIVSTYFTDERLKLLECKHKVLFDNLPRNTGINEAIGDYIIYLDIDDYWGEDHLKIVENNLDNWEWVWFNDFHFVGQWMERACNIRAKSGSGTSNICHKRSLELRWDRPGYAHDYYFTQKLLTFKGMKIETPEYFVCHIPGRGGYDL